jgi:hypothetical protein
MRRNRIANYHGIVIAYSAGSMNCAELVYASHEVEGECMVRLIGLRTGK